MGHNARKPIPWPDRLSLVNEICRRLRAGHDLGLIVTVCRCTLQLVLDLRRANQRADEIRKRWHCGLYRVLDNVNDVRILADEIDAKAAKERKATVAACGQEPVPVDEEAEPAADEVKRRKVVYKPPKRAYTALWRLRHERPKHCNPKPKGKCGE